MQQPPESVQSTLRQHGQEHLLKWWDQLDPGQRQSLIQQVQAIDFSQLASLTRGEVQEADHSRAHRASMPRNLVTKECDANTSQWAQAREVGEQALAAGRVGVVLVAGGQGTRLGFPHPKGMYPIGPVSGQSLFQGLAEQLQARSSRAGTRIPYYVMTSNATHDETVEFFAANDAFGLPADHVHFFRQGNMPAVDAATGRVLLSAPDTVALSPDGHGGMLQALVTSGLLEQMERDGIDLLYYHQVDNPTAIVADPALLGFHLQYESEVSTKVVRKLSPAEKMGVLVDVDGNLQIIEYSELTPDQAAREDSDGNWIFWAGNMAIHVFDRAFLQRIAQTAAGLPFHQARKNVPFLDESGVLQTPNDPAAPNAVKFERFIFDTLPMAQRALVVEADRDREFNPVKNREGADSPETAQAALSRLGREWLQAAGKTPPPGLTVEISPLVALGPADLAEVRLPETDGESLFLGPDKHER